MKTRPESEEAELSAAAKEITLLNNPVKSQKYESSGICYPRHLLMLAFTLCLAVSPVKGQNGDSLPDNLAASSIVDARSSQAALDAMKSRINKLIEQNDFAGAAPMLQTLADKGYPQYQLMLGNLYLNGRGVEMDKEKGMKYVLSAVYAGDNSAKLQLAKMYLSGENVKKNYSEARSLLLKVGSAEPEAYAILARLYLDGSGVERNESQALKYLKEADAHGIDCKTEIARLYLNGGEGIRPDIFEARKWLEQSAGNKEPMALYLLGTLYYKGQSVEKDESKARELFQQALPGLKKLVEVQNDEKLSAQATVYLKSIENDFKMNASDSASNSGTGTGSSTSLDSLDTKKKKKNTRKSAKETTKETTELSTKNLSNSIDRSGKGINNAFPSSTQNTINEIKELMKEFYPQAKLIETAGSLHYEYKIHRYDTHNKGYLIAPKLDGILCDIKIISGPYKGKETLPSTINESLYSSLTMAPYLSKENKHLLTVLLFPPNASPQFIDRFTKSIQSLSEPEQ